MQAYKGVTRYQARKHCWAQTNDINKPSTSKNNKEKELKTPHHNTQPLGPQDFPELPNRGESRSSLDIVSINFIN